MSFIANVNKVAENIEELKGLKRQVSDLVANARDAASVSVAASREVETNRDRVNARVNELATLEARARESLQAILRESATSQKALEQLRALKDEIGAIELEAILRDIMQEDAPKLLKQLSDEILLAPSAQEIKQGYERALESATERLNEIKAEHERHYQNTKESIERRARESSQQIEQSATQASEQIEQKASDLDTSMSERASELGALIDEKKALVDSQHEAINTQLAKAQLVAQEIKEQSFQNEIAKTLMLARFDRAINIATLMDTTLTKAKIHLHEADIKQKRDEVESMMNEVELDRQEVAKAKNDAKAFIDRASNAQASAEFNSFLEVI